MSLRATKNTYLLLAAASGAFLLSAATVMATEVAIDDPIAPQKAPAQAGGKTQGNQAPVDEDAKGMLRSYTWEGSFDKAGDATRSAETELKSINFVCSQPGTGNNALGTPQEQAAKFQRCQQTLAEARGFSDEAGSIRKQQRVFADVSRASDLAAVGAVGAAAYGQLGKANSGQADGLLSAASIQETAGYVSYASGATDFTLGAYAYMAQKNRLEAMEETIKKRMPNAPAAVKSKLLNAAEATKQAAYNHMMYGAGKAAFGAASMYMAKRNREQAARMSSISYDTPLPVAAGGNSAATPAATELVAGSGPTFNNGAGSFEAVSATPTGSTSTSGTGTGGAGASGTAPTNYEGLSAAARAAQKGGSGLGGGGGSGLTASGSSAGSAGSASGDRAPASEEGAEKSKEAMGDSFEMSLGGGGGGRYGGGGGKSSSDDGGIGNLLANALGGEKSAATGLNPNAMFKEATGDLTGHEQGSMAGVNGGGNSLFQVIKTKYIKLMEGGRVQGPGMVNVKN